MMLANLSLSAASYCGSFLRSFLSLVAMVIIGATLFDLFVSNKATHKVAAGPKDLSLLLRPSSVRPTEDTKLLRRPMTATKEHTLR